ncbi:MAG: EAL domain-containing protein [Pseudomonadota bacterium]
MADNVRKDSDVVRPNRTFEFDKEHLKIFFWIALILLCGLFVGLASPFVVNIEDRVAIGGIVLAVALGNFAAMAFFLDFTGKNRVFDSTSTVNNEIVAPPTVSAVIPDNVKKTDETAEQPYYDSLTRLGSQQRMIEKYNSILQSAKDGNRKFLVGIADIDGMRPVNDLYGYDGGNSVLQQCAQRLSAAVQDDGYVFRLRGDEFGFLFPEICDAEGAAHIGNLLKEVLTAPFDLDGCSVRLTGSFGFAISPDFGSNFNKVMKNIASALYHSKRDGQGKVTVFSSSIEAAILEKAKLEQNLRSAIQTNEVKPHFQPIISLQSGELLGFEALARWHSPELGSVSPDTFIPLAEERGIIAPLTEKLLRHAASIAAHWPEGLFLSFNLSSAQLVDPTTGKEIIKIIESSGLPTHRLEIEVTETAIMSDPETAAKIIDELHEAGIRISMDDFGTGQSSLGRLKELKLDKVKIDRAFIMPIAEERSAQHIVRAILEMCAGLELTVVAEGIEEIAQAEKLKEYGCHAGQGFLFGKPLDENKTMGYIREFEKAKDKVVTSRNDHLRKSV